VLLVLLALEAPLAALFKDVLVRDLVSTFVYNFPFNRLGVEDNSLLVASLDKELVLIQRASYLCGLLALIDIL
jgi:hypothetical protein